MTVSVIVPTTRPDTLDHTLSGIAAQVPDVPGEVLLVHDGVAPARPGRWPFRVRSIALTPRQGVATAWNVGVQAAEGDILAFCDDDDRWRPDHLAESLRGLPPGLGAAHGAATVVDSATALRHPFHFPLDADILRHSNALMVSTLVMRRDVWEHVGPFDASLSIYADWDWAIRACDGTVVWHRVPRATVDYAWNSAASRNSSAGGGPAKAADMEALRAKHGLPPLPLATFFTMATDPRWDRWRLPPPAC